jgi:hypothetical protein
VSEHPLQSTATRLPSWLLKTPGAGAFPTWTNGIPFCFTCTPTQTLPYAPVLSHLGVPQMDGDLKKIRIVGEYMIEVWKAAGMNMDNVEFLVRAPVSHAPLATRLCRMLTALRNVARTRPPNTSAPLFSSLSHGLSLSFWLSLLPRAHCRHGACMIVFGPSAAPLSLQWASDEINRRADEYWLRVMDIATKFNLKRMLRCCTIMGRTVRSCTLWPPWVLFACAHCCASSLSVTRRRIAANIHGEPPTPICE